MRNHGRRLLLLAVLLFTVLGAAGGGALAATPASGTVSPDNPTVTWQGKQFEAPNLALALCPTNIGSPGCEFFVLTVQPPAAGDYEVTIKTTPTRPGSNFDLYIWKDGERIAHGSPDAQGVASFTFENPAAGDYEVHVFMRGGQALDSYTGEATMTLGGGGGGGGTTGNVAYTFDPEAPSAEISAPLRVVLVGFGANEIDEANLISQVAPSQRPGVLIPQGPGGLADCDGTGILFGGETLVNHGRCFFADSKPFLVPVQYDWKPQVVHAPATFTDALFAQMAANSTTGNFKSSGYRNYIEKYNANRGIFRGADKLVLPNAPVRFIDAEKVEDWLGTNARKYLGFDIAPPASGSEVKPGYTIFVLNTWDSPLALKHLTPQHEYHTWKIVRPDPDLGTDEGIDWARVWGGRYREMILDLGAAPNPYESETWGNRGRAVMGSDSFDPPLWEYRANALKAFVPGELANPDGWDTAIDPGSTWDKASLEFNLARFVIETASFRFLHSYLYEPRPQTGKYYLSSNVWHDAKAEVPWASDLKKVWNETAVLEGLRTLVPYFTFDGDTQYKYLTLTDDEQAMLEQAKQDGFEGVAFTAMSEPTAMNWIDARPARFYRGGSCYTNIPSVSVVAEKHYAFGLPVLALGVATNRGGVPWGFLASVNDVTKGSFADRDPIMQMVHPSAFENGFTYTATHEISHYLGLAHPHDTMGAWKNPDTGEIEYFYGFTWTFNSTAAPTTYSHVEMTYSILDQESVARGHAAYYIRWAQEALKDAGDAFVAAGKTNLAQLDSTSRLRRWAAIKRIEVARNAFARLRFIPAAFEARAAWWNAAALRDRALGLPPGTTELQRGTKAAGAAGCASATADGS